MNIPTYPDRAPVELHARDTLHPILCTLKDGTSELTFSNLFLFRKKYNYHVSMLTTGHCAIWGEENGKEFWIFPQGFPDRALLQEICEKRQSVKCIPNDHLSHAQEYATHFGYRVVVDRDNFDYLYQRSDLAELHGRKFHKKRNLIHNFEKNHVHRLQSLGEHEIADAHVVLEAWHDSHTGENDYHATKEALDNMATLQLCGYIVYNKSDPIAFALGEGIAHQEIYIIHFEKAIARYTGIYQYINRAFAATLPKHYTYINREQDMGDAGMRQAKMTYRPIRFVEKYRFVPKPKEEIT